MFKNLLESDSCDFKFKNSEFLSIIIKCSILGLLLFVSIFVKEFVYIALGIALFYIILNSNMRSIYYIFFLLPLMNIFIVEKNEIHLITIVIVFLDLICFIRLINETIKKNKKINYLFLIMSLLTILYFIFPFNIAKIKISLSFLSGYILIFFVINFSEEINYKEVTYIYFLGMLFSIFIGLFIGVSPRLKNLCPIFKACDLNRFGACYANVNVFAGEILISVSLFMILYLKNEIGYLFFIVYSFLLAMCLLTISKFSLIVFGIIAGIFLILILINKEKSIKEKIIGLTIFILSSLLVILILNKYFVVINKRISEIKTIDSDIKPIESIENGNSTETKLSKFTTGRWDIWKSYLSVSISNLKNLIFGLGVDAPYVNNEAPHNTIILFIYYFGIIGTLLYCCSYIILLKKERIKNFNFICILSIIPVFAFLNYLGFYSCVMSLYLLLGFINLFKQKNDKNLYLELKEKSMEKKQMKEKIKLAILTPTYNRENLLTRCYESLKNQTNKNFKWYIIDDGSTDNTEKIVKSFIENKDNNFGIEYIKKKNGGKHSALNAGLKLIQEKYITILDSDDSLIENAVDIILKDTCLIDDEKEICGIGYLRVDLDKKVIGKEYTQDGIVDTFIEQRYNKNTYGDKCEVFKTEILKQYPFPEIDGERFLSEATVWCKMSGLFKMMFFNKGLYICEYQPNGLSDGVHKRLFNNPKGAALCYKELSSKDFKLKLRIKYTIAYIVYSLAAGYSLKEIKKNHPEGKFLINLLYIPSKIYYKKQLKKYSIK